jgi:hypothetical protein
MKKLLSEYPPDCAIVAMIVAVVVVLYMLFRSVPYLF